MSQSYSEDCNYGVITNGRSSKDALMTKSMVQQPRDSRTIEESLALIQHHVKVSQNVLTSLIKAYIYGEENQINFYCVHDHFLQGP